MPVLRTYRQHGGIAKRTKKNTRLQRKTIGNIKKNSNFTLGDYGL